MQTSRASSPTPPDFFALVTLVAARAAAPWKRLLCGAALALLVPFTARAQAVLGAGEDATLLPGGVLRIRVLSTWTRLYERYVWDGARGRDAVLQPLGAPFTLDTIGAAQIEQLAPLQASIRTLAGLPDFNASLGKAVAHVRDNVLSTPVAIDLGLTRWIQLGVEVPFITATADVGLRVNPTGREATVGFNPTLAAPAAIAANGALLTEFDSAAAQLSQRLALCAANPGAVGCGALNANAARARALIQAANTFAGALAGVYGGRDGALGSSFVPIAGTTAQAAIEARVAAFKDQYKGFGTTAITRIGPTAAQAPFTAADLQRLLTDPKFGIRAQPLATSVTRGVGDIDLSLKVNLFDSFHGDRRSRLAPRGVRLRQSVGAVYRLGTGSLDLADDFTDLGTGDHQNDVELRSFTDVLLGAHFWMSLVARYNIQLADERTLRITDSPDAVFAPAYREQKVKRDLGDVFDLEVDPRWTLNDFVGLTAHYYYRRKFADAYTGKFSVTNLSGQPVTLDAATLDISTAAREHRFGAGASYSTVAAFEKAKARVPLEVTYFHFQTTRGSGGSVPKLAEDRVSVRVYWRLFGR